MVNAYQCGSKTVQSILNCISKIHCNVAEQKKRSAEETQTLHAGCSKVEPKNFAPPQTPFAGAWDVPKFNQLEMVITFTYKPSLVKINARNFELSW